MNDETLLWSKTQTFLSPDIKKLYDSYSTRNNECCHETTELQYDSHNAQEFLCKWNVGSLHLNDLTEDCTDDKEWFSEALKTILPLVKDIPRLVTPSSLKLLSLEWTGMHNVLQEAVEYMTESNVVYHYIALLQITAVAEKALGQVFLLKGQKVPFLLRDLLNKEELKELLGKELVDFLRILMGSVFGLNIRNLAWHGFLGIQDIHWEHAALILLALHHIGEVLRNRILEVSPASYMDLEKVFSCLDVNTQKFGDEEGDPLEIVRNSPFVYAVMRPHWEVVVKLISQREKKALLLMLPLIENALRVLYANVNCRPFSAVLTATDSAFYVTMDEILHPWMTSPVEEEVPAEATYDAPDQNPNLVPLYLGRQLTEAFYDLFHHTAGPRLRDRVSHCEIACHDVPFEMVRHLFRLCLLALSVPRWRFLDKSHPAEFSIICGCTKSVFMKIPNQECHFHYSNERENYLKQRSTSSASLGPRDSYLVSYISSYEGRFHPCSLLKQCLLELVADLRRWKHWGCPSLPNLPEESCCDDQDCTRDLSPDWKLPFGSYSFRGRDRIEEVSLSIVNYTSFSTVFFSKLELEIVRTLQRIGSSVQKSLENVRSNLASREVAFVSKRLRSRQRDSYFKQVASIPAIVSHLVVILEMLLFIFSISDRWRCVPIPLSLPLKALLKCVLKTTENFITFTDSSVNKYYEAREILAENSKRINSYFVDSSSEDNFEVYGPHS